MHFARRHHGRTPNMIPFNEGTLPQGLQHLTFFDEILVMQHMCRTFQDYHHGRSKLPLRH